MVRISSRVRALAWIVPALLLAASPAFAYKTGFFGLARSEGCTCHGLAPLVTGQPVPTTQLFVFIDGDLASDFAGYVPGGEHTIELWVLGPILPFAGFNLDVSAGELSPADDSAQVKLKTECGRMNCVRGAPGCGVRQDPQCPVWEAGNPACKKCSTGPSEPTCRLCEDTVVLESEATHTEPKPLPSWTFTWRPPATDVGPVSLYAVGNSVSGEGQPEIGDGWNFLDPNPIVIAPAP